VAGAKLSKARDTRLSVVAIKTLQNQHSAGFEQYQP
jgi:hypothetical protein